MYNKMFVSFVRLKDESFGKYNLPDGWRYESVTRPSSTMEYFQFVGPKDSTDDVKECVYLKFMELKNEGIISTFKIFECNSVGPDKTEHASIEKNFR